MIRIGYLGPKGTFSELAALGYLRRLGISSSQAELEPAASIAELFRLYQTDLSCDRVLIPVENSIEGPVLITQDLIVGPESILIEEEFSIPIVNHLLIIPGTDWRAVTDVVSHPQPIGQCQQFLKSAFHHSPRVHVADSTASAAEMVSRRVPVAAGVNPELTAAIGSDRLAEIYGLEIAQSSIQDSLTNRTRFWVLSRSVAASTGHDKTTIVFSALRDHPGGLVDVLSELSSRGINLTSISSRPTKTVLGEYLFYVDLCGHRDDADVSAALVGVKRKASFFKWVGSYHVNEEQ